MKEPNQTKPKPKPLEKTRMESTLLTFLYTVQNGTPVIRLPPIEPPHGKNTSSCCSFAQGWVFVVVVFLHLVLSRQGFSASPGCPGTHSVDQDGLKLRNLPASTCQSAGIKGVCPHGLAIHKLVDLYSSPRCIEQQPSHFFAFKTSRACQGFVPTPDQ